MGLICLRQFEKATYDHHPAPKKNFGSPLLHKEGKKKIQNSMKIVNNIKTLFQRRKDLRNESTREEILLWMHLNNSQAGFKFRRQHSIGGYIVDFYCPTKKLIVELDGSQHLTKDSLEYDTNRSKYFEGLGIK